MKLVYVSEFGKKYRVKLTISRYVVNNCLCIRILHYKRGRWNMYGNITTNLEEGAPDYYGYVDVHNMPTAEKFLIENGIGCFTGVTGRSGYCEYPLYYFVPSRLRELCPEGMAMYENSIQTSQQKTDRSR